MRLCTRLTLLPVALLVAAFGDPSRAALDVDASLQRIDTATVATVVLVPPMAVFQSPLNQAGLRDAGCHYTTDDVAAIRSLVALVKAANVNANALYQRPDMREGVYFTLADGSKFSLLYADNSESHVPLLGLAETTVGGQVQSGSVSVRPTLSLQVRDWAKRYGGTGTGSTCNLQFATTPADPEALPPMPTLRAPASPVSR